MSFEAANRKGRHIYVKSFFDILLRDAFVKGLSLVGVLLNRTSSKITYYRRKSLCLKNSLESQCIQRGFDTC